MKRSPMPGRKTALPRGKPLKRSVPLTSRTRLQRSGTGVTRAVAATPGRDTGPARAVRRLVYRRCGAVLSRTGVILEPGWCEWPGCTEYRQDLQHRLGRKNGGRHGAMDVEVNSASYLLAICRHHHDGITSQSGARLELAKATGWVLVEGQDARAVPVLTRHDPAPVLLDDAGTWTVAA